MLLYCSYAMLLFVKLKTRNLDLLYLSYFYSWWNVAFKERPLNISRFLNQWPMTIYILHYYFCLFHYYFCFVIYECCLGWRKLKIWRGTCILKTKTRYLYISVVRLIIECRNTVVVQLILDSLQYFKCTLVFAEYPCNVALKYCTKLHI